MPRTSGGWPAQSRSGSSKSVSAAGRRLTKRNVLRRLAFVRAARNVGLSLDEVARVLSTLPKGSAPNRSDWTRLSRGWRCRLDEQINALTALRDGLD